VGGAEDSTGGIFDDLVGLPIGSRVLIVAPAAPGRQQTLDTAVIAVDVLAQVTTAKQMRAG
jgi:phosphate starvation-inducible protein PhoH